MPAMQLAAPSSVAAGVAVGRSFAECCQRAPVSAGNGSHARFRGPQVIFSTEANMVPCGADVGESGEVYETDRPVVGGSRWHWFPSPLRCMVTLRQDLWGLDSVPKEGWDDCMGSTRWLPR